MSTTTPSTPHDDDGVIADLPDLRIEVSHHVDALIVEQGAMTGNPSRVAIHKWQVQMLAEQMGLTLAPSPSPRRDVEQILARRLRKMHERIDELGKYLYEHCEDEYAQQHAWATCEIGDEYLADLAELLGSEIPRPAPQRSAKAARPTAPAAAEPRSVARRPLGVPMAPAKTAAPAPAAGNSDSPSKVGAQGRLAV